MTGDGSDTTLTLSIAPVNENNTQVFFDGVYQNKSTYSISGTTLTFSTAPPTGVAVEVMTFTQTDINVPVDGTITSAKLSGDLTAPGTLTSTGVLTANAGVVVDNITIDGTEIDLSSGDLTIDVAGSITLDSDGGVIDFDDAGTNIGRIENASSDFKLESRVQDKDIVLVGNDAGTGVEALRLDMSEAGAATFNSSVSAPGGFLNGANGGIRIHSGGAKFFNVTAANAARDNIMDIGASDARFKDLYLGGSVYLGGNTSNGLDDYEEGNYTPTFVATGGTAPGGQSGTGKYVKIGSVVHVHGQITWTSAGSGGSNLYVALPFTVLSNARAGAVVGLQAGIVHSANHYLTLVPEINDTKMYLIETQPDAGGHDHLNYGNVTTDGSQIFSFSATYTVS